MGNESSPPFRVRVEGGALPAPEWHDRLIAPSSALPARRREPSGRPSPNRRKPTYRTRPANENARTNLESKTGSACGTLYWREVRRFIKVYNQTRVAPVVTSLLFLAIFALALGHTFEPGRDAAYPQGFSRTWTGDDGDLAERLRQHVVVDDHRQGAGQHRRYADAALTAHELTLALAFGGVTRGVVVGIATALAMTIFVPLHVADPFAMFYFAFTGVAVASLLGLAGGISADKFDHIASVTNFIVIPLSFLSGTVLLDRRASAAVLPRLGVSRPVLLHDRRISLLLDGPRRHECPSRNGGDGRVLRRAVVPLPPDVCRRLQAQAIACTAA